MNAFGYRRCPHLADDLVQADGLHVAKLIAAENFRGELYHFVFEP